VAVTELDIVMPYYGDVPMMQTAVRSVLAQEDGRWHLTVVDDGAAEGVPEWFAGLGDPRVTYLRNERNLGITANFQKCLELAGREFMVMMGCDDRMLPNYVGVVRELIARHPEATILQPGVQVIDTAGEPVTTLVDQTKRRLYAPRFRGTAVLAGEPLAIRLLRGNWLYFPALCWRTTAIAAAGFREQFSVIQDLDLVLRLVVDGAELVLSDEVAFQYRRHAVSKSSADAVTGARFTEARDYFMATAAQLDEHGWHRAARAARRHLSSRIHAATQLPAAARRRNLTSARTLAAHVLGSPRRR
jgi:glycosyltransferase involved in cell wall biosynthesis